MSKFSKFVKKVGRKILGKNPAKTLLNAFIAPLGLSSQLSNKLFNELRRLEDKWHIPGIALIGSLLVSKPHIGTVMKVIETFVKGTRSKKFGMSSLTRQIFDDFKKQGNFPYKHTYNSFMLYYHANLSGNTAGITFENRIYFQGGRPDQTKIDDLALIFHEYVHTHQYYKYGLNVFAIAYAGNYLLNLLKGYSGSKPYYKIDFEKEAYRWQYKFAAWTKNSNYWINGQIR